MKRSVIASFSKLLCTPGVGLNLWGESPLCMDPIQRRETRIYANGFKDWIVIYASEINFITE